MQAGLAAFRQVLADLRWVEGRNLRIDHRWFHGDEPGFDKAAAQNVASNERQVLGRIRVRDEAGGRHTLIGVAAAWTHDGGNAIDNVQIRDLVAVVIPVGRDFVANPEI